MTLSGWQDASSIQDLTGGVHPEVILTGSVHPEMTLSGWQDASFQDLTGSVHPEVTPSSWQDVSYLVPKNELVGQGDPERLTGC